MSFGKSITIKKSSLTEKSRMRGPTERPPSSHYTEQMLFFFCATSPLFQSDELLLHVLSLSQIDYFDIVFQLKMVKLPEKVPEKVPQSEICNQ